jgi:hypothetical protein
MPLDKILPKDIVKGGYPKNYIVLIELLGDIKSYLDRIFSTTTEASAPPVAKFIK